MKRKPLRIRVTLTVEVDREAYDSEYNDRATADEIRSHVKSAAYSAVESDFRHIPAVKVIDYE